MKFYLANPFTFRAATANHVRAQKNLRSWNIVLGVIYAALGLSTLLLSTPRPLALSTFFSTKDSLSSQVAGETVFAPATHVLGNFNLIYLVALLLFGAAVYHALLASSLRNIYEADLRRGVNRLRWLEYGFCGGLIVAILAAVAGMHDIASLAMLYGLVIASALVVVVLEVRAVSARQRELVLALKTSAVFASVLPWLIIGLYIIGSMLWGAGQLPAHIRLAVAVIFGLFLLAAANIYMQRNKFGVWANYYHGERIYLVLVLVIKALLAGLFIAGVLSV
jgi:hypothetical protein